MLFPLNLILPLHPTITRPATWLHIHILFNEAIISLQYFFLRSCQEQSFMRIYVRLYFNCQSILGPIRSLLHFFRFDTCTTGSSWCEKLAISSLTAWSPHKSTTHNRPCHMWASLRAWSNQICSSTTTLEFPQWFYDAPDQYCVDRPNSRLQFLDARWQSVATAIVDVFCSIDSVVEDDPDTLC